MHPDLRPKRLLEELEGLFGLEVAPAGADEDVVPRSWIFQDISRDFKGHVKIFKEMCCKDI